MEHTKHSRVVTGLTLCLGLVLGWIMIHSYGPRTARAADNKIFAPHFCVPIDPDFGEIGQAAVRVDEIEQITQQGYQTFVCPVVRDVVTGDLDDVWVRVGNENSDEDTPPRCCVYSTSLGATFQDSECVTMPDTETTESLHFSLSSFTEYDHGHYTVTCDLGIEDTIISYRTREI